MRASLTRFIQSFKSYKPPKNQAIGFDQKILSCLQKNHNSRSISSVAFRDDHVKSHPNSPRTLQAVSKNSLASHLIGRRYYTPTGDHAKHFNFIADAVEIASPAVVYVEVAIQQQGGLFGGGGVAQGAGSGFIVTDYGVILTNAHVVTNSRSVSVKLASGDVHGAEILDIDPVADLAVLKIKPENKLPTIKLGNSATLRPGEWVIALGSPLNLSNTVTAGIVSTVHRGGRDIGLRKGDMKYIQTDAAINRGNSGGPLINLDAEVIGINTMTLLNTTGISFAVPIDRAKAFLLQALEKQDRGKTQTLVKKAQRPYIGIKMMSLYPQIEGQLRQQIQGFPDVSHGVLVVEVVPGSPAQRGGLQPYDVITEVEDVIVSSTEQLHEFVRRGREMNIKVTRPGNKRDILRISPILQ
ncbi:serine protease HTRA1B-like [Rhopilema esculentum]|uniref:serine protease HTRA1B-like n=1 Tax=Rhopilema esculentum TaxID=499914 RepID=UPI0031D13315|eukprot:gene2184-17775_t